MGSTLWDANCHHKISEDHVKQMYGRRMLKLACKYNARGRSSMELPRTRWKDQGHFEFSRNSSSDLGIDDVLDNRYT